MDLFRDTSPWGTPGGPQTPSSCSPNPTLPTLPRAASTVVKPCLTGVCFLKDFMPHHRLAMHVFYSPPCGIITSLDLAIRNFIYRMRASGACRDFFSRSRERFQSILPPSRPPAWLAPGRGACRAHAGGGRCNVHQEFGDVVIESFFFSFFFFILRRMLVFFSPTICSDVIY